MTLLLTVAALVGTALAGDSPVAPASSVESPAPEATGTVVSADLHDEYISGERLVVPVVVRNSGAVAVEFPDLSARPWLVRFDLVHPGGKKQTRFTTPPPEDPGRAWTISPRGQRRVLLEIPSGANLPPGEYSLEVRVEGGSAPIVAGSRTIRIAPARPEWGDVHGLVTGSGPVRIPWVHRGTGGWDVRLIETASGDVGRSIADWFLFRSDHLIEPRMSATRGGEDPHLVWKKGDRTIAYARVGGDSLRDSPQSFDTPWPRVEVIGRSATTADGTLQVPVWVPAPKAESGDLWVASVSERGAPSFHRMTPLPRRPEDVHAVVDASGSAAFLVRHLGALDLYTVRTASKEQAPIEADLPVPGRRLWKASEGEAVEAAEYAVLPDRLDHPGGLGIVMLVRRSTAAASGSPAGESLGDVMDARWLSLTGALLQSVEQPWRIPQPAAELELVPHAWDPPGVLTSSLNHTVVWVEGATRTEAFAASAMRGVARDRTGVPVVIDLVDGGPFRSRVLTPQAP